MRVKLKPKPVNKSRRDKTRFLFLPKLIGRELRWLETASWRELYQDGKWKVMSWSDEV